MSSTAAATGTNLAARAAAVIPGGVNSGQRQVAGLEDLVIASTSGSTFTDGNGRVFTDYHSAFGPPLLGHNDPDVDGAVAAAGAHGRPHGRRRHAGRGRARGAARRRRAVGREGAADRDRQRGDLPRAAARARRDRPAPRHQVPGLLPRLARRGRDERDLARRARRARRTRSRRGCCPRSLDDTIVVPFNDAAAVERALDEHDVRRDHPRADPAQHRRGAAAARLPRAAARARDEARGGARSSTR